MSTIYALFTGCENSPFNEEVHDLQFYKTRKAAKKAFNDFVKKEFDRELELYEKDMKRYGEKPTLEDIRELYGDYKIYKFKLN